MAFGMDRSDCAPRGAAGSQGHLVIELRPGQRLLVNGAELQFRNRASIALCNRVRFLFGRQVLAPSEATTPARRLYLAMQVAYAGDEPEREASAAQAHALADQQMATRSEEGREILALAMAELAAGRGRPALTLVRRLFAEDDSEAGGPQAV